MPYLDLVADILKRVSDRECNLSEEVLREIEMEARADWGGERHYVAKVGEAGRLALDERNRRICEAHKNGVPNDYLALRHNLSEMRIWQIINEGRDR